MISNVSEIVKWSGRLLWRGIVQIVITVALIAAVYAGYFLLSHGHYPPPRIETMIFGSFAALHILWRINDMWKVLAPRFSQAWQEFQNSKTLSPDERRIRTEKQMGEQRWLSTALSAMLIVMSLLAPVLPRGGADALFFGVSGICHSMISIYAWRMYFHHRVIPEDEIDDSTANDEHPWYRNVLR